MIFQNHLKSQLYFFNALHQKLCMVYISVCVPPTQRRQKKIILNTSAHLEVSYKNQWPSTKIVLRLIFFLHLSYLLLHSSRIIPQGFTGCVLFNNRKQHWQDENVSRLFFSSWSRFFSSQESLLDMIIIMYSPIRNPGSLDVVLFIFHHSHEVGEGTAF